MEQYPLPAHAQTVTTCARPTRIRRDAYAHLCDSVRKKVEPPAASLAAGSVVAGGIAELRNPYGTGHGKPDSYKGLTVRHAKLAVGSATTLVEYL